ncbi:MAG: fibronectin type III domain-containing protein, partial [Candidatus Kapaibacteriota bacterium]
MKQFYKKLATLMLVCLLGISNQVEVFAGKPGTNSRFITIGNLAKTTATVSWINGNGNGRLLVVYTGNVTQTDVDNKINDGILYSSNSNFGATGSQVLINNASGRAVIVYLAGGSTRTVNITNLIANTTYSVKAYEYKNDGGVDPEYLETGGTNNPVTFKTLAQPLPTKPTNLAAGSITDKNALASWTNGTDVEWYTMDLINYDLGQVEWEGVDIGKPNPAQFLIEGLAADTDYGYRLQSHNTDGASGYTNYHAFTTSPDATKPEMMSTEYINSNQFRLFFTEPVSFVGDVKTKFTISFYNNSNNLVSEQIIGITLEGPDNTSAICSTSVDLSTIRNGEDVRVSYENIPSIYVKDLANNTMVTPSEIFIRDWTPSNVLSSVRTKYVNPNWVTTGYGTNATTIHFLVTFDEKVKLVDANFKLDIVDGGDSNPDGTIGTITKVDLDVDGYASIYAVQCSTNVDDDCDDYSISITQNNGDDIIRDMSGNEMTNTTISGPKEDYKVDRLKPSSSDHGP